jgi:DNA-binding PadR family transcriptional regulator
MVVVHLIGDLFLSNQSRLGGSMSLADTMNFANVASFAVRYPSTAEIIILKILSNGPERYGLELVQESNGWLKRGTVYATLYRMQKEDWIIGRQDKLPGVSGIPKVKYQLSSKGRRILEGAEQIQNA